MIGTLACKVVKGFLPLYAVKKKERIGEKSRINHMFLPSVLLIFVMGSSNVIKTL